MTRILIVDDKEENLYYLRTVLTAHGCTVESACHGAEALVKARQNPPDLVVSDLLMPVMDGYTLLRHWKADERLKKIPFIVYTATYTEEEDERLALSLGADAFILKPAEPEDFLSRIREVQANMEVPTEPKHPVGDEKELLKLYSETLIRKLEKKTLELEEANRALRKDIAGRQAVEEALRQSEARFAKAFRSNPGAMCITTVREGRFVEVNEHYARLFNYAPEELIGQTSVALGLWADPAVRAQLVERLKAQEPVRDFETHFRRRNGDLIHAVISMELIEFPGECEPVIVSMFADITERRKLEQQFLRAQRMESIGTLAGGIAHDLNNVLTPIMTSLELLQARFADPDSQQLLAILGSSAQRGADMVRQVLSFARGVEGRRMEVQIRHLIRDLEKITAETFPKHVHVRTKITGDLRTVMGDPTQLHQVLLNLCLNARDAMPDGGTLTVSAEDITLDAHSAGLNDEAKPGAYVAVQVEDTGTGMPPAIIDHIFDPFFTTKEVGKGTGLGLSTSMAIVKSHGGFIRVYSEVGRGTMFKVFLPAHTHQSVESIVAAEAELPRGHGEWILIVDDEAAVREITHQTLEAFGYRGIAACNGAEAVAIYALRGMEIAVVLTDMMMPVLDGPAMITVLQRMNPKVRIIAASGLATNEHVAQVTSLGVKHFLPKPYMAETLLKVLQETLASE